MKKILSALLAAAMLLSSSACTPESIEAPATETPAPTEAPATSEPPAEPDGFRLDIDGRPTYLVAYPIFEYNYFKLRDLAAALKGTKAQFDVSWNQNKMGIELLSGIAYSAEEPLTAKPLTNPIATRRAVTIYKDGEEILLEAYAISGNYYFRLLDVAAVLNVSLQENSETGITEIDTAAPFAGADYMLPPPDMSNTPEVVQIFNTPGAETEKGSVYYAYAAARDEEFRAINRSWQTDSAYYWLADVDRDGLQELIVRLGAGIAVYKEQDGSVNQIFYDRLEERADGGTYGVTNHEGLDYVVYTAKSSPEGTLFVLKDGALEEAAAAADIVFSQAVTLDGLR